MQREEDFMFEAGITTPTSVGDERWIMHMETERGDGAGELKLFIDQLLSD